MTQFRTGDISTSGHGCFFISGDVRTVRTLYAFSRDHIAHCNNVSNQYNPPKKNRYGRSYSSISRLLPFNLLFVRGKTYWPKENVES